MSPFTASCPDMKVSKIKLIVLIILAIALTGLILTKVVIKKESTDSSATFEFNSIEDFERIDQAIREILEFEKNGENLTLDDSLNRVDLNRVRDPFSFSSAQRIVSDSDKKKMVKSTLQKPIEPPKPEIPKIHLEGIIFDKKSPMAIIDGEVYRVGDVIKGFRITEISQGGVRLKSPDDQIVLKAPEIE